MTSSEERQALEFELHSQTQPSNQEPNESAEPVSPWQELRPVDGGRDAWVVLIAGFVFEALFWGKQHYNLLYHNKIADCIVGFPMCFGVFQNYYSGLPEFQDDRAKIPLIGTIAQGLYYLGAPFSAALTKRFPKLQRQQIWFGWPLCIFGLLSASFATSVTGLIGTQGLLYGLGFVTLTYPILSMVNEWWVVRKGMAFGLISAASGATGAVMPFILESLLAKYGYRTTLQASAVAMTVLTAPLLPLFKGRLPPSEIAAIARTDWAFLKRPLFWIYGFSIFIQGLGFFFPVVFLPSYSTSVGLPAIQGALLLALMSIAQVIGQFTFGFMSDKNLSVGLLAVSGCVAAAAASFALWGPAKSMPLLTIFSLVYGFFAFGFGTLRVAMGKAISNDPTTVFTTYAIFVFLQGIGNVLVGPVSASLLTGPISRDGFGAGKYGSTIIFTGGSSMVAALVIGGWHIFKRLQKL